MTQLNIEM